MEQNLFAYEKPAPDFSIPFRVVPSWNDVLTTLSANAKFNSVAADVKKWRKRGRARAAEVLREAGHEIVSIRRELKSIDRRSGLRKVEFFDGLAKPLFEEPVACLVRLWRPTAAAYDVHNLVVKPILDGFGDVRVYESDAVRGFPELGFVFEGVDGALKLSGEELEARQAYQKGFRDRGKEPPRMPLPARILFDFYRLSRLKYRTIYQFEIVE